MKWSLMTYTVSSSFPGGLRSLEDMAAFAHELGFQALELSAGNLGERSAEEFGSICRRYALAVSCINGGCDLTSADDFEVAQGLDQARYYVDMAVELECPTIMLIPGFAESLEDKPRAAEQLVASLNEVIPYAAANGVLVTVEDFPNRLASYGTIAEVRSLLSQVPGLRLTFDNGNWMIGGDDPLAALLAFGPQVVNVHLKDWEPAPEGEGSQWADGQWRRGGQHGRGLIDQAPLLRELQRLDYQGYLAFEYEGPVDHVLATREGFAYLQGLLAG